jgi:hypothetical protein
MVWSPEGLTATHQAAGRSVRPRGRQSLALPPRLRERRARLLGRTAMRAPPRAQPAAPQRRLPHPPHLVWLKYCVASRGLSMIVAEQSTEAFAPYHATCLTTHCSLRRDQPVVETLVIALRMVVGQVCVDRMMQGAFT